MVASKKKINMTWIVIASMMFVGVVLFAWLMTTSYPKDNSENQIKDLTHNISIRDQQIIIYKNVMENKDTIIANLEIMNKISQEIQRRQLKVIVDNGLEGELTGIIQHDIKE